MTPLLNDNGDVTGFDLPGAVTVPLTDAQATRATSYNSLWLQGGDVDDPVLDKLHPQQFGFAALRCAIDNLNGDNVEWIAYPAGARHVLCYAYYVQPPPTSGTIIVKKVVAGGTSQSFRFTGNISYAADHSFSLAAGASQTFFRAAGSTPDVHQQVPAGWTLDGVVCTSAKGTSTSTVTGPRHRWCSPRRTP